MSDLRDAITGVLNEHPGIEFHFCRPTEYEAVLEAISERFLARGRHDLKATWWWTSFADKTESFVAADLFAELRKRLHPEESYWFVANEEDGNYWVAEASGAAIFAVLRGMRDFEYYIIDRKMTWILCDSHHNTLIEARAKSQAVPLPML